ncbi:MAG: glutamate racemase [Terrimicrobiaceae bacterium]|jgi:glutamate racemase|nr:glutamate racemase [Terrimicrobiaceae bacterium]
MPEENSPCLDPIGVFDSGIGGLTVVAALRELLPSETIFYIGDTARVPYGGKSRRTIERYSVEIGGLLLAEQAKILVVACNTASALAVPRMKDIFKVPVQGVVAPGAAAALKATKNKRIGVIGTRATISSGAYEHAICAQDRESRVFSAACPLLVPLIEEGMFDDPVTDQLLGRYLEPLLDRGIDTLVLGCTHYPLLRGAITRAVGPDMTLVDSARNCALAVKALLFSQGLSAPQEKLGRLHVALTDSTEGFLRTAEKALGLEIGDVELRAVQISG